MHKIFKFILATLLSLLFLFIGFYFWASSPKFSEATYNKIIETNYPQKNTKDSVFSIVTYNIGYLSGMTNNLAVASSKKLFDNNLNTVLNNFKSLNPDIIAFQEIDYASKRSYDVNQQNEIAKLGYKYVGQAVNWDKNYLPFPYFPISMQYGRILSGQSILSKYKITNLDRVVLERNQTNPFYYDAFYIDRLAQIATIEIQGKKLILINVHVEAFHQETRRIQMQKVVALFNQYRKTYPTILLGDFNSDPAFTKSTIQSILNLQNVGNAVFLNGALPKTFNSEKPTERLDYIFYNTDFIEMIDGKLLKEFGQASDHLPLEMQFKFK